MQEWIDEMAKLCKPDKIYWCDGSEENENLLQQMVASGAATPLNRRNVPAVTFFRSHPSDVARVEERTYISSRTKEEAGPTNNWGQILMSSKKL